MPMALKIRQSHAKLFENCRMLYKLSVVDKLVPLQKKPALSIGTACHAGRAEWLRSRRVDAAIMKVLESIDAEVATYPALAEIVHEARASCKCVGCMKRIATETVASYCSAFEARFPGDSMQILAIELPFEEKLADYEDLELWVHGTCDADAVYAQRWRVNFEYKTTKKALDQFFDEEYLSRQHTIYPYILSRLRGERFHGTILDVSRKPTKENPPIHDHIVLPKTDDEYSEAHIYYVEKLKEIHYAQANDYFPQNPDQCFTIRGRCPMHPICKSGFAPSVIKNNYGVVDDLAQIIAPPDGEEQS